MKESLKSDEAARRIWPVLVEVASLRESISYSALSDRINSKDHRLGWPLGLIQEFCLNENLPAMTVLVISKVAGEPGHGFTALSSDEVQRGRESVWNYSWASMPNPFAYAEDGTLLKDLEAQLLADPQTAAEMYARVGSRGNAQVLFRKAVCRAYGYRCAFCGLSFEECLEAAHIVPWAEATPAQRVSPTNGICLCANHHRLFDTGWITLSPTGQVIFADEVGPTYSVADIGVSTGLHRKNAQLPKKVELRPSVECLNSHYIRHEWSAEYWAAG